MVIVCRCIQRYLVNQVQVVEINDVLEEYFVLVLLGEVVGEVLEQRHHLAVAGVGLTQLAHRPVTGERCLCLQEPHLPYMHLSTPNTARQCATYGRKLSAVQKGTWGADACTGSQMKVAPRL